MHKLKFILFISYCFYNNFMIVVIQSQLSENEYFREEAGRITGIDWE